jgi:hypothetical protein
MERIVKVSEQHVWVGVEDQHVHLGLTNYIQGELDRVISVELPDVGDKIEKGEAFAEVESTSTVHELISPVSGTVLAVNPNLEEFPAVKFPRPETLKAVEICRRSGLLATPGCAREVDSESKNHGTFNEYGTAAQIPKIRCDIHGGGVRSYAREYDQEEWPRAATAVDLSTVRPVAVMSPTVLGLNDVYIALLTAKGQELDRQKGQEVGADVYMTKPFDPEVILQKARDVLDLR